jgi:hypothetical protein
MKLFTKLSFVLALVLAVTIGTGSSNVFGQGKQPSYTSGVQFANLENTPATLMLTAYKSDGSSGGTGQYTVDPNGSLTLFPLADVESGFSGAIVLSSDKNGAAIANVLASDFSAGASYVGRSAGATSVRLPLLNKNNSGFDTWFSVQNAGSSPAQVSISYSDGESASATVPPNFAGTVTSDNNEPLVAAVIQENASIMFAYTGFTNEATTNPVFPLVNANNSGYISGIQIQNAGDQTTDVTLSYTFRYLCHPGLQSGRQRWYQHHLYRR